MKSDKVERNFEEKISKNNGFASHTRMIRNCRLQCMYEKWKVDNQDFVMLFYRIKKKKKKKMEENVLAAIPARHTVQWNIKCLWKFYMAVSVKKLSSSYASNSLSIFFLPFAPVSLSLFTSLGEWGYIAIWTITTAIMSAHTCRL